VDSGAARIVHRPRDLAAGRVIFICRIAPSSLRPQVKVR
jgi:hypothetical protein